MDECKLQEEDFNLGELIARREAAMASLLASDDGERERRLSCEWLALDDSVRFFIFMATVPPE